MSIKSLYLPLALVGLTTVSFIFLSSDVVSADDSVVDQVIISVSSSCTMSSSGENSHTATVPNNTTRSDIGTTTVNAFCNDGGGFAIYAIGYTDDTYGKTVLASATLGSTKDIATGTATSGSTSNWAMKLTNTGTTYPLTIQNSFGSYHSVPNTYTLVASRTTGTAVGTGATGATFTTTYRAFISSTQPADTYTGKVKYTMVHPNNIGAPATPLASTACPANKICYAPNAYGVVGSMDSINTTKIASSATAGVQNAGSNAEYTLIAPNYSRAGYGFAGWSTDFEATNSSTIYGPNETITTGNLGTNGMILYPVWVASTGTLQNWNDCRSLTTAPTATRATLASMTALTDARDNNVYTVARLADSNCWMTENLRLNADATGGDQNKALSQGYGSYSGSGTNFGNFIGLADSENANFYTTVPSSANNATNSIYSSDGSTTININSSNSPQYRIPRYNSNNTNRSLTPNYSANNNTDYYQWYGYGNYYNWPAAVANTNYSSGSLATTSLCPTGWTLPKGGNKTRIESYNDNNLWTLIVTYLNGGIKPNNYSSSDKPYYFNNEAAPVSKLIRTFPNNFIYSGGWSSNVPIERATAGHYWSFMAYSNYGYDLTFSNIAVYPATGYSFKYYGFAIRCMTYGGDYLN